MIVRYIDRELDRQRYINRERQRWIERERERNKELKERIRWK